MNYIDNNLLPTEQVLYRTQAHWAVFLPAICWTALTLFFLSLHYNPAILIAGYLIGFMTIFAWIQGTILFMFSEFGVTDKRVIIKVGFISRITFETLLQKVESIQVTQGVLGRILNYGTITVCGTGGSRDVFKNIDDPLAFRQAVHQQISQVLTKE